MSDCDRHDTPLSELSAVGQACTILSRWTGLELRDMAPRRVGDFLRTRAEVLGYDGQDDYVGYLRTLESTDDEPQKLINLITNGLTCFWRDAPQLDALKTVIAKITADRGPDTPVNIWCAGCSTGEEAYTVAMIARDQNLPAFVLGSDINTDALDHARRGLYDEWSLRRTDPVYRQRYFEPADEPGRFRVADAVQQQVEFRRHNITSPAPPPPADAAHDRWDVVLCRNVLIYFSDAANEAVLRHLGSVVDADGYLLLGSSEQLHTGELAEQLVPFRAARQGGGFVYRLRATPPGQTVPFPPRLGPADPPTGAADDSETLDLNYYPTLQEDTSDVITNEAANSLIEMAVDHLGEADLESALACCEATASYDPFVAENYCLMGYILAVEGARLQAIETYRKALFLDPFNWIAAIESARLHLRQHAPEQARRALRQALEGLDSGRPLSTPLVDLDEVLDRAITSRPDARRYCEQYLARLRAHKFIDDSMR